MNYGDKVEAVRGPINLGNLLGDTEQGRRITARLSFHLRRVVSFL